MKISLTNAALFLSILEAGSLTTAAARNNLVAAAVSARMKRLEGDLGLTLFERDRYGMRPTLAGLALEPHARRMVDTAGQAEAAMQSFRGEMIGQLRVLSNSNMLSEHLPRLLGQFLGRYPDITVEVEDRPSLEVVDLLRRGLWHIGVVAASADRSGLEAFPFVADRLVAVVPPGPEDDEAVSFATLLGRGMIGLPEHAALAQFMRRTATELGIKLQMRLRLPCYATLCEAVAEGAGSTIMAESAARRFASGVAGGVNGAPSCRIVPLSDPWAQRELYICSRAEAELPAPARQLLAHFRDYAERQASGVSPEVRPS
ncbi:LysR family transcriptional regulator [Xinfangfangia sp. D13-10-4-6]|uniref:LysR substrate-binding domain-containing protein n=1 Tax=Pseudogemmobacter hezensis TaxID=2737662 RepID=UPI001551C958|nr:LysR substrate-binding domain-containing protein [Pseudogemmobacter hezensis]NPD17047.1 LysR family transcriptional regulator [Pseudogemmobacter hezensis]